MLTNDDLSEIVKSHGPDYDSIGSCVCGESYPCTTLELIFAVKVARRERDLAVAHDLQDYPTVDAYERVCRALRKRTAEMNHLRKFMSQRTLDGEHTELEIYEELYDI